MQDKQSSFLDGEMQIVNVDEEVLDIYLKQQKQVLDRILEVIGSDDWVINASFAPSPAGGNIYLSELNLSTKFGFEHVNAPVAVVKTEGGYVASYLARMLYSADQEEISLIVFNFYVKDLDSLRRQVENSEGHPVTLKLVTGVQDWSKVRLNEWGDLLAWVERNNVEADVGRVRLDKDGQPTFYQPRDDNWFRWVLYNLKKGNVYKEGVDGETIVYEMDPSSSIDWIKFHVVPVMMLVSGK